MNIAELPGKNMESTSQDPKSSKDKNKKKSKRFSEEQVKSLESIFRVEPKLDPGKKVEVAMNLGLDPRQVAIWFQNKRARWRSKEIELEYKKLRANYDSLHMQFDHLKKENQSLQMQIHDLNDLVENLDDEVDLTNEENEFKGNSNGGIRDKNVITKEFDEETEDRGVVSCKCNEEEVTVMSHLASPEKCDFSCWWES